MYSGIRSFIKGLLEHSQSGTIATWVDCRLLTSVYVNSKFIIGGKEVFLARGSELLLALHAAAKDKTLSESEGKAIADYLVQINWKFDTLKTPFYLEVFEQSDLTNTSKQDIIKDDSKNGLPVEPALPVAEQSTETAQPINQQKAPAKKAGRPAAKKS